MFPAFFYLIRRSEGETYDSFKVKIRAFVAFVERFSESVLDPSREAPVETVYRESTIRLEAYRDISEEFSFSDGRGRFESSQPDHSQPRRSSKRNQR